MRVLALPTTPTTSIWPAARARGSPRVHGARTAHLALGLETQADTPLLGQVLHADDVGPESLQAGQLATAHAHTTPTPSPTHPPTHANVHTPTPTFTAINYKPGRTAQAHVVHRRSCSPAHARQQPTSRARADLRARGQARSSTPSSTGAPFGWCGALRPANARREHTKGREEAASGAHARPRPRTRALRGFVRVWASARGGAPPATHRAVLVVRLARQPRREAARAEHEQADHPAPGIVAAL